MESLLSDLVALIASSSLRLTVIELLRGVPGLPPIVQTFHILAIGVIVATFGMLHLKMLGLAAHGQSYDEMWQRLQIWAWGALGVLFLSGAVFVVARPERYFSNPVFGIKVGLLTSALVLSVLVARFAVKHDGSRPLLLKIFSALGLLLWIGVILAGRWIAYADYLFWEV